LLSENEQRNEESSSRESRLAGATTLEDSREFTKSCPGGTGMYKAGSNPKREWGKKKYESRKEKISPKKMDEKKKWFFWGKKTGREKKKVTGGGLLFWGGSHQKLTSNVNGGNSQRGGSKEKIHRGNEI